MKYSKKLMVCASALIITMHSNAENLPGRTRNLNILRYNKYMWLRTFASENDSNNILRDLACNCDNPDFELNLQLTLKPFAILNKLGHFEKLEDLEKLLDNNPIARAAAEAYLQKLSAQAERNGQAFIEDNLKEMLFSSDKDGKTVTDILEEKQSSGKMGCVLLKELFEVMKQDIIQKEEKQKERKEIEELVSRMIH